MMQRWIYCSPSIVFNMYFIFSALTTKAWGMCSLRMYVWKGIKTIPRPQEYYRAGIITPVQKYLYTLLG